MTKTLTEQWREGTLPQGYYYTKVTNMLDKERIMIDYYIPELHHFEIMPSEYVKEVIVEAPSYEEWQSCEKCADMLIDVNKKWGQTIKANKMYGRKLDIAIMALKDIKVRSQRDWDEYNCMECADKALKEMEGVK